LAASLLGISVQVIIFATLFDEFLKQPTIQPIARSFIPLAALFIFL